MKISRKPIRATNVMATSFFRLMNFAVTVLEREFSKFLLFLRRRSVIHGQFRSPELFSFSVSTVNGSSNGYTG
jgi:hypothetical protein